MPHAERQRLLPVLRAIYSETYTSASLEEFAAVFFSAPGIKLMLYFGVDDEIVGYAARSTFAVDRADEQVTVHMSGLYLRQAYRGGAVAALHAVRTMLGERLRRPLERMAFVSVVISPAMYRLLVDSMPRAYPRRDRETPVEVDALQAQVAARLGLPVRRQSPWVLDVPTAPHDTAWFDRARSLRGDPDVAYYLSVVPGWAAGRGVLTWVELGVSDLLRGGLRMARRALRRRLRSLLG